MHQKSVVLSLLLLGTAALAADRHAAPPVEYLNSKEAASQKLPFSEAVRVGSMLYLSGVIGVKPGTFELVPGGIEVETRQAMQNMQSVLERYGSSLDNVVKCTVAMARMSEWSRMNSVYVTFFKKHMPARSALGANGLALGASVEIECIATVREGG